MDEKPDFGSTTQVVAWVRKRVTLKGLWGAIVALVLALTMLMWLPASLRLGRSMGMPRGRQAVGAGIVLAVNVVLGLYPQPLLSLAGL